MDYWYSLSPDEALSKTGSSKTGLSSMQEVEEHLQKYGFNELKEEKKETPLEMFLGQFKDFLILILIAAAVVSGLIGEMTDAAVILIIVALNAILGFVQEYRAEKAMNALKKMVSPSALVYREGRKLKVPARELVLGDVVELEAGDRVPADLRLLESVNVMADESPLTGESNPVAKSVDALIGGRVPVADRRNMLFMGTTLTYGRGKAVVVETGMRTEIGKIAEMIQRTEKEETPLQRKLDEVGKKLGMAVIVICIIIFLAGILRGESMFSMFLTSVSLAVAAIPEGLPAIVTITLAIGLKRMAKRNAIIRKLPAVETLGCATVICSDKTGTLTRNEMTACMVYVDGKLIEVTGEGYAPEGEFIYSGNKINPSEHDGLSLLLRAGVLCNHAFLDKSKDSGGWRMTGDPTEGTLIVLGAKAGFWRDETRAMYPRIGEILFDSQRKRMTTIHKTPEGKVMAYSKGAPDILLDLCMFVYEDGAVKTLTSEDRERILSVNREMADDALRVLGLAYRKIPDDLKDFSSVDSVEKDLVFIGLVGMIDMPREDAKKAIVLCEQAGIKPVMITGDHKITAVAVARELGLLKKESIVLTGVELDNMPDGELERIIGNVAVYARVSPEHKMRIVKALKKQGHVVAMTGDGVNDAPALKNSDIGVAMGITGTDVTKEAADMILADDNFASIVAAIEEGRGIYDNIRKFIKYLLSCNMGEVLTIFTAIMFRMPLPLLPIQILWMNLVTDGLPALALGIEPSEPDIMGRPPRKTSEEVLSGRFFTKIISVGLLMCFGTLLLFGIYDRDGGFEMKARTVAFTTLVMFEMFYVFTCRSERFPLHKIGFTSNKYLILAVLSSIILQLAVIYIPFLQSVFDTVPLGIVDWLVILGVSSTAFILPEMFKIHKK